jgi:hypothetical protein
MPAAAEAKEVELEKVPEEELRRPKVAGWVKEDGAATPAQLEAEKRAAFQDRMKAKKDDIAAPASAESTPAAETKAAAPAAPATSTAPVKTVKTSRKLPSLPGAAAAPAAAPAATTSEGKTEAEAEADALSKFCPFCGKDLDFKFCPFCGKPLPHEH